MVALYGKTGPEFTAEDVAQARQNAKDCAKQVGKAERTSLAGIDKLFARGLGPVLEKIEKAGAQLEAALATFAEAPDGTGKLRALAAFRSLQTWDRDGSNAPLRPPRPPFTTLAHP